MLPSPSAPHRDLALAKNVGIAPGHLLSLRKIALGRITHMKAYTSDATIAGYAVSTWARTRGSEWRIYELANQNGLRTDPVVPVSARVDL